MLGRLSGIGLDHLVKNPVAVEKVLAIWRGELNGRASSNACWSKLSFSIGQLSLFEQKAQVSAC
jgi:hypothetical protein